jgi:AcrR family transcriptional regulator
MAERRRERKHEAAREEIKLHARAQMARAGTAGISLREIARNMDMTAPALYRYFPSLADLITALLLDGFNGIADAVAAADAAQPHEAYGARMLAALCAYRRWALDNRVDFELMYGNPIPGYEAPAELTIAAAARTFGVMVGILAEAEAAGVFSPLPEYLDLPPAVAAHLETLNARDGYAVSPTLLYVCTVGWARIHGMIMLELFGHTPPVIGDPEAFYRHEVLTLMQSMGMRPPD